MSREEEEAKKRRRKEEIRGEEEEGRRGRVGACVCDRNNRSKANHTRHCEYMCKLVLTRRRSRRGGGRRSEEKGVGAKPCSETNKG
jgi:hypothetical protein